MTNYKQYLSPDCGKRITIVYDDDPIDPRGWDNTCTMICFHGRYTIGDKHDFKDPGEVKHSEYSDRTKYFRFPLHLLDHSGLRMKIGSFGQGFKWDSGQVGWIFVPIHVDSAYVNDGANPERSNGLAYKIAMDEVMAYDQFLSGDVYGVAIEESIPCEHCGHVDWEVKDSCYGLFGLAAAMTQADEFGLTDEWTEVK